MLDFPDSPADGEQTLQPNGVTYQWDATYERWDIVTINGGDYAQGSYTVNLFDNNTGGNQSSSSTIGYWTRIGNQVTVRFAAINSVSVAGMVGGQTLFFSLPFPASANGESVGSCNLSDVSLATGRTWVVCRVRDSASRASFRACGDGVSQNGIETSFFDGNDITNATMSYTISDADKGVGNPAGLVAVTEGVWSPVLEDASNNAATATSSGVWQKVGRHVTLSGRINITSLASVSGTVRIVGFPFSTSPTEQVSYSLVFGRATNMNVTAGVSISGSMDADTNFCILRRWSATGGTQALSDSQLTDTTLLHFTVNYMTDD